MGSSADSLSAVLIPKFRKTKRWVDSPKPFCDSLSGLKSNINTMITGKIDVTKVDKTHLFKGKAGTYLDIALITNKAGRDQYGNDGMIVQSVSKQARQDGHKGPILGNYVEKDNREPKQATKKVTANDPIGPEDDIPF